VGKYNKTRSFVSVQSCAATKKLHTWLALQHPSLERDLVAHRRLPSGTRSTWRDLSQTLHTCETRGCPSEADIHSNNNVYNAVHTINAMGPTHHTVSAFPLVTRCELNCWWAHDRFGQKSANRFGQKFGNWTRLKLILLSCDGGVNAQAVWMHAMAAVNEFTVL